MQKIAKALAPSTLALGLVAPLLAQVSLPVSANMDIYRAGGYNDGSDGIAPVVYSFTARPFQTLTFSSVAGEWTCNSSVPEYGADGTATGCFNSAGQYVDDAGGPISGYGSVDFTGAMVGVFLEDALPSTAPSPLLFYVSDNSHGGVQTDFKALNPKIGQVFFIGDGLTGTGSGSIQVFEVPPTATHLYLGYVDSCNDDTAPSCYSDNVGSLTAVFQIEDHELNWVSPSLSQSPPPRCCMAMAYDYARRSTLLFGGSGNLGDTWSLQREWSQLSPAVSPSPRIGAAMVWDGAAGNIVLFGGDNSSGIYLNDTWTWDGTTWTQQFPAVSPPARSFNIQSLAYDGATRTVVLFGGANSAGSLGDTWIWNGTAKTWTQQFPAASPSPRQAAMAYDAVTRTVVLFGGVNAAGGQYTDTWTWDGTTWTQHFPATSPPARTGAGMAYDASLGAVVLFGGYAGIWEDSLNDTWTWNGINWTKMNPATVPPNRYGAGMTYDPLAQGVVMFGGYSSGPARNDTWFYGLVPANGANQK
jgi:hypothetical protein